jgi:hypothetical protein
LWSWIDPLDAISVASGSPSPSSHMPHFRLPSRRLFAGKHRHAFTALLFFLGIPLIVYTTWGLKMMGHREGEIPHTGKGEWPVRFSELKPGERILIDLASNGCRDFRQHQLVFDGAHSDVTVVLKSYWPTGRTPEELPKLLGGIPLNAQELVGLDRFLDMIRVKQLGCTTLDTIRIDRFRGDVLVGSEQFSDGSGLEHAFEEDHRGKIVFSERYTGSVPGSNELLSLGMLIRIVEKQTELETLTAKTTL